MINKNSKIFLAGTVFLIQDLGIAPIPFKAAKYAPIKLTLEQLQPPALIVLKIALL